MIVAAMAAVSFAVNAQQVKNVIVLIPDGTSLATVSLARWYQLYNNPGKDHLAIDPYLSGTVRTTCSNAPIGDSAPTTSCYMTGYTSLAGWVATYPTPDPEDDLFPMDAKRAYQPLTTVLEAARLLHGASTGLVCTCEFPQATPADCSSHSYDRGNYGWIMPQQVHNSINVMIGGGAGILPKESEEYLKSKGYGVFRNDINAMRAYKGDNMWALYGYYSMDYDIDRDPAEEPGLDEMTTIAIDKLSRNPNGFFLMVEGSRVDAAAHNNDPIAMVTDYLAFDRACKVALDFAERDGNTAVVVLPDHGNSGVSIGRRGLSNYSGKGMREIFGALSKYRCSADLLMDKLNEAPFEDVQKVFKEWCGFEINEKQMEALKMCKDYEKSPVPKDQRKRIDGSLYSSGFSRMLAQFMTENTGSIGFTTTGHTGEDVFLACYHPQLEHRARGMLTNVDLNAYLCSLIGTTRDGLDKLTEANFAPHQQVLADYTCTIGKVKHEGLDAATLSFKAKINGKMSTVTLYAGSNVAEVKTGKNVRNVELPTVVVYVDKNDTFYINRNLLELVK